MSDLWAALWVEILKARRSKVLPLTGLGILLLPAMSGFFMVILKDPEGAKALGLISMKAQILGNAADWPTYVDLIAQGTAIAGGILFAIITAWVFGREFSDHMASDLLALPVRRESIVVAKFVLLALWVAALVILLSMVAIAVGVAVRIPGWSTELGWRSLRVLWVAALLDLMLMPIVAFVAGATPRLSGAIGLGLSYRVVGAGGGCHWLGRLVSVDGAGACWRRGRGAGSAVGTAQLCDRRRGVLRRDWRHAGLVAPRRPGRIRICGRRQSQGVDPLPSAALRGSPSELSPPKSGRAKDLSATQGEKNMKHWHDDAAFTSSISALIPNFCGGGLPLIPSAFPICSSSTAALPKRQSTTRLSPSAPVISCAPTSRRRASGRFGNAASSPILMSTISTSASTLIAGAGRVSSWQESVAERNLAVNEATRPAIVVQEFGSATVALPRAEVRILRENFGAYLDVQPEWQPGYYRLTATHYVGAIQIGELHIRIEPKTAAPNLFYMLTYAFDLPKLRDEITELLTGDDIFEFVVSVFVRLVEDLVRKGIYRAYQVHEESHPFLRGRILLRDQLRNELTAPGRFAQGCTHELSEHVP